MTEQQELNQYTINTTKEPKEAEFYYEREDFEYWLEKSHSSRGKKRNAKSVHTISTFVRYFFTKEEVMSARTLKEYRDDLLDNGIAPATINGRIMAHRTYLHFLAYKYKAPWTLELIPRAVVVQKKQFIENVISRADFDFLVRETRKDLKHPNVYLGIKIMGVTGLRRCELFQVKVEHIKHGYVDVIGKGGKQRRIYFPKNARAEILEYLAELGVDSGYVIRRWKANTDETSKVFTANTRDNGNLQATLSMERLFNRQLEMAGQKYGIAKELMHPHGFRHFFAKEFLKHRLDISLLADLLGHSSLEITRIYLKMTSKEQADVVDEVVTW